MSDQGPPSAPGHRPYWVRRCVLGILVLGAVLRARDLVRPLDQPSWRECDVAAVARNFYQEGMNLAYPRIDWRKDGPGYAEMEFPLYPWLMACGYHLTGVSVIWGRAIAWALSLVTLAVFAALSLRLLDWLSALAAQLSFAVAPLVLSTATSLQPEGLMLACYVASPWALLRWIERPSLGRWLAVAAITALALLAKLPAAHLGLLFAAVILGEWGWAALRRIDVWLLALVAVVPAAIWYSHAHRLWLIYGNSLGVSNETHWAGLDLLRHPHFLAGIARLELYRVWTMPGVVLGAYGLLLGRPRRSARLVALWLAAIALFYLVAGRTTGDDWAAYYHIVAAPPAALAIGLGSQLLVAAAIGARQAPWASAVVAGAPLAAALAGQQGRYLPLVVALALPTAVWLMRTMQAGRFQVIGDARLRPPGWSALVALAAGLSLLAVVGSQWRTAAGLLTPPTADPLYAAADQFRPLLEGPGRLVVSGGAGFDETGRPVAYDASYFLYWLERFGWTIPLEQQSLETLETLRERGARWFIAEQAAVRQAPGFAEALEARFTRLSATPQATLYDLGSPPSGR